MSIELYSNGKLLLTGEYAVLDGAFGLAIPTRFGQSLKVSENNSGFIEWKSYEKGNIWFQQDFELGGLEPVGKFTLNEEQQAVSRKLRSVISTARDLNTGFLSTIQGCEVATHLNFNRQWGLGTSSTLINNLAQWAEVDPYTLLDHTFGGSGYDIACANADRPVLYRREDKNIEVIRVNFNPQFSEFIHFVYLNKKQDSRLGISAYREREFDRLKLVDEISEIGRAVAYCQDLNEFHRLIALHETLISIAMKQPKVQEILFPDYDGTIKSLGAWGGDFVMATSSSTGIEYFKEKGYHTVIPFSEMVL